MIIFFKNLTKNKKQEIKNNYPDYFKLATSWADDYYTNILLSRNRYKLAFIVSIVTVFCLSLSIITLMPFEHFEPILIHQYADGMIEYQPISLDKIKKNKALLESEIVKYINARESYDPVSYEWQYNLVSLMSNIKETQQYQQAQSAKNKNSVINTLKKKVVRTVNIESIIFPDESNNSNIAEVNFTLDDTDLTSYKKTTTPLVAIISWYYKGIPKDPRVRWRNWDGFTVTDYQVSQRNI